MPDIDVDGTAAWTWATPDATLSGLVNLDGTAVWAWTSSASLYLLRRVAGTAAWTWTTTSPAVRLSVLLAGAAEWVWRTMGGLFYAPKIDPVPTGVSFNNLSQLTVAMPTPTLDSKGRPVQPWTPS